MLDQLLIILFVALGLALIMLVYCLVNLSVSLKTLFEVIAKIQTITSRVNTSIDEVNKTTQRLKQPISVLSLISSFIMIVFANHIFNSLKK